MMQNTRLIEHSENKIITYFKNEVEHGVLPCSVQQTCTAKMSYRTEFPHNQWQVLLSHSRSARGC